MAKDNDFEKADPERLIADANRVLAKLQRERLRTLSEECLPAYDSWTAVPRSRPPSFLTMDSATIKLLSGSFDENDFVDSTKSDELDRAAESFAMQLRLYRKRLKSEFDVFLCHNSEDKREVRSIAAQLKRRGFLPWIDKEELQPGMTWQSKIQQDIDHVKASAVIVGPLGIGPWQRREVEAVLQLFVDRGLPVVPLILPSCKEPPELPIFLRSFGWVDYRTLDPDPLEQLIWGITGRRPAV